MSVQTAQGLYASYEKAFHLFLKHTDQKVRAGQWLFDFIERLPSRQIFIDAGAGAGAHTVQLKDRFARTIAIEPNKKLNTKLRKLSGIEVIGKNLGGLRQMPEADLVLCSHVFYLLEPSRWLFHIRQMLGWLSKEGALVIISQNRGTDCQRMRRHFWGETPHLSSLYGKIRVMAKQKFEVQIEKVDSFITTSNLDTACEIARFLFIGNKRYRAPKPLEIREYLIRHCADGAGGYRLSCHQDMLIIRRSHPKA